jgi:hypothetical protein
MALTFETKIHTSGPFSLHKSRSSRAATPTLSGEKAPPTADLPLSNVVSAAKNDQLNNPVARNRKAKGMHERIW